MKKKNLTAVFQGAEPETMGGTHRGRNLPLWAELIEQLRQMTLKMVERVETTIHPNICMGDALPKPIFEGPKNCRCRFCCKVGEYAYIAAHQQTHERMTVKHGGYKMYRCYRGCIKTSHYHCCYCGETRTQPCILKHVQQCTGAASTATSAASMVTSTASAASMVSSTASMVTSTASMVTSTASAASMVSSTASMVTSTTSAASMVSSTASMVSSTASPASMVSSSASAASMVASTASMVTSAASTVTSAVFNVATASLASTPLQCTSSSKLLTSSLKRMICPFCNLILNKKNLKIHIERRHSATASVASTPLNGISSSKVLKSSPKRTTCPFCNLILNQKNLKMHIDRRHSSSTPDITANRHLPSQCLDQNKGIFAVGRTFSGLRNPIHVQKRTWGNNHQVICELEKCKQVSEFARRSGLMGFQCIHLRSLLYCPISSQPDVTLKEEVLSDMVVRKWISDNEKNLCLARKKKAESENSPLSKEVKFCSGASRIYVSVLETCTSYYSRLGRVAVCYDKKRNSWHCPCSKPNNSCPHKSIAKWHLNQTQPELFLKVRSTDSDVFETSDPEGHSTEDSE